MEHSSRRGTIGLVARKQLFYILSDLRSSDEEKNIRGCMAFETVFNPILMDVERKHGTSSMVQPSGIFGPESTLCLLEEHERTRSFLRAVVQHTHEGVSHVLDAGTGATAILALQAAISKDVDHVTAVDIFPPNVLVAQKIVRHFGLDDKIRVVHADATQFRPDEPVDLLLSETMDSGVLSEPIFRIVRHLRQFLTSRGLIIPCGLRFNFQQLLLHGRGPNQLLVDDTVFADVDFKKHEGEYVEGRIDLNDVAINALGLLKRQMPLTLKVSSHVDLGFGPLNSLSVGSIAYPVSETVENTKVLSRLYALFKDGKFLFRLYPGQNKVAFLDTKRRFPEIVVPFSSQELD